MHAVSVSGLKHNPADALRQARNSPVVVLNRDHPDAVLIGLEQGGVLQAPGVRAALTLLWIVKPCHASVIGWWLPGTGGAG